MIPKVWVSHAAFAKNKNEVFWVVSGGMNLHQIHVEYVDSSWQPKEGAATNAIKL